MSSLKKKTFATGIILVIVAIITIAVFSFRQSRKIDVVSSSIEHTRNILLQLNNLYSKNIEHAGAARNYSLNGNEKDIQKMQLTASDLMSKLEQLKILVKERPGQQMLSDSLAGYIIKRIEFSNQLIIKGKEKGLAAATELYQAGTGREYNNIILSFIQKMQTDELNILQQDEQKNTNSIKQLNNYLSGLLIFILILIIILLQKGRLDITQRKKTEDHLKSFNLQLQKQVKEKTTELSGVFERITDGFIALDKNFCFTYVNKRAGEMTGRDPDSFIGKNIWKEFDKSISPQFHDAILKAMEEQEYVCFEEYSPAYDCWFEDHLYPSPEGLSIFYRDISERKKTEEELRISGLSLEKSYKEIRLLASNIENIREEEKIKIAREIHDELGQQLTGLKMDVAWLRKKLNPEETALQQKTMEMMLLLDEAVRSIGRIASELRPGLLDDLGLVAAIEWQSEEFEKRSGIKTEFKSSIDDGIIPSRLSTGFFRIYQESLTNVARHAQADKIIAILEQKNNEIVLQITDDGNGFDAKGIENKKTLGLLGMKERTLMMGGRYEIISEPGKGTTVIVAVPLSETMSGK